MAGWRGDAVLHACSRSSPSRAGVYARASAWVPAADQRDSRDLELGEAMERVRGARRPRLRFIERFHNSPALAETAPFPSSNAQEDVAQIRRIRLLPPLLPLAVKVQYHAAQQRHRCKSEDQQ